MRSHLERLLAAFAPAGEGGRADRAFRAIRPWNEWHDAGVAALGPGMSESERKIVAVGLLTLRDLETLGAGFRRAIPLDDVADFEHLIAAIDEAERRASVPD